jgi:hypothetical protein
MPDLTPDEYAALKADIAERGVMVPVEYDEDGNILDGCHRVRICDELGIRWWPRIVRKGLSEEGKRAHARTLNLARRHLSGEQRRELIAQQLRETPEQSNRQIADALGVSHHTVADQRVQLESIGQIAQCDRTTKDGRHYPRDRARPRASVFVSADDAQVANELPADQCETVMRGDKSLASAVVDVLVVERMAHAVPAEIPLATADTPAFDPPVKPLTNNQRKFRVTEAIRTLAETDVSPNELQCLMQPFEFGDVSDFLDAAITYLDRLKWVWRTT